MWNIGMLLIEELVIIPIVDNGEKLSRKVDSATGELYTKVDNKEELGGEMLRGLEDAWFSSAFRFLHFTAVS